MSFLQDYGFFIGGVLILLTALLKRNNASQINQYINTINMLRVDMVTMKKENSDKIKAFEVEFNALRDELHDKDKSFLTAYPLTNKEKVNPSW